MERFHLAKDESINVNYDGPDWCPFNLWMQYGFGASGPNPKLTADCARRLIFSPGARELWQAIGEKYEWSSFIPFNLPVRCAEFLDHWRAIPRLTPGEHKAARLELQRRANQLAQELERFFDYSDYDDAGGINFTQLLTEEEQVRMDLAIRLHNQRIRNKAMQRRGLRGLSWDEYVGGDEVRSDSGETYGLLIRYCEDDPGIVPDLPTLMRRIGDLFAEDSQVAPIQRPNANNAERNYFTRRLIAYFRHEHGSASPSIVAQIVSIFFEQGITDNEVSQQMGRLPDGRKLPIRPETSPPK